MKALPTLRNAIGTTLCTIGLAPLFYAIALFFSAALLPAGNEQAGTIVAALSLLLVGSFWAVPFIYASEEIKHPSRF